MVKPQVFRRMKVWDYRVADVEAGVVARAIGRTREFGWRREVGRGFKLKGSNLKGFGDGPFLDLEQSGKGIVQIRISLFF